MFQAASSSSAPHRRVVPPNPATGVQLGTIAVGATVTVIFNVLVTSVPTPAQLTNQSAVTFTSGALSSTTFSNAITTPVYQPIIGVLKAGSTSNATVGDTIVYTLNVSNTGNYAASTILTDTIPAGTSFQPNSVFVGTTPAPGADPQPALISVPCSQVPQFQSLSLS